MSAAELKESEKNWKKMLAAQECTTKTEEVSLQRDIREYMIQARQPADPTDVMFDGLPYNPVQEIANLEEWIDNRSLRNRRRRDVLTEISSFRYYTGSYGYHSNFPVMTNRELRYFLGWEQGHHGKNGRSYGTEGNKYINE